MRGMTESLFRDREDAGRQLSEKLEKYRNQNALVLGVPRGGVEVGYYIAAHLNAELSVVVTKKLPHPMHPEYGIGAVCEDGSVYMSGEVTISEELLKPIIAGTIREISRRVQLYRQGAPLPDISGRTVIIVDDGIATGTTLVSAMALCRRRGAAKLVVAVPFSGKTFAREIHDADELIILHSPDFFNSVGQAYDDFSQLTDEDVLLLLRKAKELEISRKGHAGRPTRPEHYPLASPKDLDALLERIGDARLVLLGEASHGTHEFYTWRTAISKRLIEEKGFNFIAVEGDWPDCYRINRYIKGYDDQDKSPQEVLKTFNRWPTWMWANWEIAALVQWLRDHNSKTHRKAGFYGLDVYSLWESLETLVDYLRKTDPPTARIAEKALYCFSGYNRNEQLYAKYSLTQSCQEEVLNLLREIRFKATTYDMDPEAELNTVQNAYVAAGAEKYYRSMIAFDDRSWNIRDRHMMETLNRVLDFHGADSKAIIWEHNTHIGDARFTNMIDAGLFNIGQLAREKYSELNTVLVGFGSYSGRVIAGESWGAPMQEMSVPPAGVGSIEEVLHRESATNRYYVFNHSNNKEKFNKVFPHRAIGVVYNPAHERGNYVPSRLNRRYDAFVFLDETTALHPIYVKADIGQVPETYPFEF